eukprot:TRINITY_DN5088_c0_g1_i1.p2 TRINITY_DN5088_c0_g1~~TRINITY_DN5088_c0_g1_i1.p2  ORF type:complete len:259 (+),score=58.37 TRINITY_DN5088_c0_g1_i1:31-777(+)
MAEEVPQGPYTGEDCTGTTRYSSLAEVWNSEEGNEQWYSTAVAYWTKAAPSLDAILGGFPETSNADMKESRTFLQRVRKSVRPFGRQRAVDCGCGIGRVTQGVLAEMFDTVDLLEPCGHLLAKAKEVVPVSVLGQSWELSLQSWTPPEDIRYDCICLQWCTLYLTDRDLVTTLRRLQGSLTDNGVIFIKENLSKDDQSFVIDKDDCSIMRSDAHLKHLIEKSGLTIAFERLQKRWPADLFPLKMYALY